jgi:hypothetical protein
MIDSRKQVITGLVPPQQGEARIREVWPSVTAHPAVARLGQALTRTIILAPLAWLLMAPFYFVKILPGLARRYTLTNQRVMIRRGMKATPTLAVALADIDDVRLRQDGSSAFFRSGDLDIVSQGKVVLTLPGVPEPESLRQSIMQAVKAWVPGKATGPFVPAKAPASA